MRNKAGFMILALLLLTVPTLANAWTLTVKVSGASADNYVTTSYKLADGSVSSKSFKGNGTSYIYPTSRVTVARTGAIIPNVLTFAGFSQYSSVPAQGNQILTVTYNSTVSYKDLNLTQAAGGAIYAQNLNNTWSATGVLQAPTNTVINVAIAADVNHKILGYHTNLSATVQNVAVTGAAGEVVTVPITLSATETIIPDFAVAGHTTASLFAPTAGTTGTAISCNVTATSNDNSGLNYAFVTTGPAAGSVTKEAGNATSAYSFTPAVPGTYTVTATITSTYALAPVVQTATILVADAVVDANQGCVSCHSTQSPTIVANYGASIHSGSAHSACSKCHTPDTPHSAGVNALNIDTKGFYAYTSGTVTGPKGAVAKGAIFCTQCHSTIPHQTTNLASGLTCNVCHTATTGKGGTGDAHSIQGASCVGCHAVGQSNPFTNKTLVNDNDGVRAVVGEFGKWSHHIVNPSGKAIADEQCAVCHLEGTVGDYGFGVDGNKHMVDGFIHLRNADSDADLQWDPEAPNHATMDTFCLSCHDANGATSPMNVSLQKLISPLTGKTANAGNPFGDTISNQYDKMARPRVVDAAGQFATGNNSHHAVLGKRYTGNSRLASGPAANGTAIRQIGGVASFTSNSSAILPGTRKTIYDAGKFEPTYRTMANAGGETDTVGTLTGRNGGQTLGDDSTLHCGDCHTVGQYAKRGSVAFQNLSTTFGGGITKYNKGTIGAHGSNNEYMLRNNVGTDARHTGYTVAQDGTKPYLVCFNCHALNSYGNSAGPAHAGEHTDGNNCNGPYNTFGNYTASGTARLMSRTTTGKISKLPGYGNIFGIQCAACHNSGLDNGYGGIHGSKVQTYTDGMGNTSKHFRFMPGLNNTMFVPGTVGGVTGGTGTYTYKAYSSNRKTGPALAYTLLDVRNTPYASPAKAGSYSFPIGGTTNDTNWEQRTGQVVAGKTDPVAGAMGCYTFGAQGVPKINYLASAGYPADDIRLPATDGMRGVDNAIAFGNWGACDDHNGAQGKGTAPTRNALRPVTY